MEMVVKCTCPNNADNVEVTLRASKRVNDNEYETFECFHDYVWDSVSDACYGGALVESMVYEAAESGCESCKLSSEFKKPLWENPQCRFYY